MPNQQLDTNGVDIHTPGGFRVSAHGPFMILILLVIAFGGTVLLSNRWGFEAIVTALNTQTETVARASAQSSREHQHMLEAWEGVTYMLSLPQNERPRLYPPEGLRRQLRSKEVLP